MHIIKLYIRFYLIEYKKKKKIVIVKLNKMKNNSGTWQIW